MNNGGRRSPASRGGIEIDCRLSQGSEATRARAQHCTRVVYLIYLTSSLTYVHAEEGPCCLSGGGVLRASCAASPSSDACVHVHGRNAIHAGS